MKKILFMALLASTTLFAQTTEKTVNNAVNAVNKTGNNVLNKAENGVSTLHQDAKDIVITAHNDVEKVVKYLTPRAETLLIKTAKKLEKTTDEVWRILVKQQVVHAWAYLLFFIGSIILWIRFYIQYNKFTEDLTEDGSQKEIHGVMMAIFLILAVTTSIFSSIHFVDMMTGFINPEYGAMKNIYQIYKNI